MRSRRLLPLAGTLLAVLLVPTKTTLGGPPQVTSNNVTAAQTESTAYEEPKNTGLRYLLSTPQIADPLRPLDHAQVAGESIRVRSAVVTVADPLETRLGRAFDSQVSALIRAFHAKDYVLDGFALTWSLNRAWRLGGVDEPPAQDGSASFLMQQRTTPSVLLFRKDLWRHDVSPDVAVPIGAEYFAVFLVGEAPSFGVHPRAFKAAATCALRLAGNPDSALRSRPCDEDLTGLDDENVKLEVIGPSFSGSMESVALVLGALIKANWGIKVSLRSPSATVDSNKQIEKRTEQIAGVHDSIKFAPLAASLETQLRTLARYTHTKRTNRTNRPVVILAEESTFGRGVSDLVKEARSAEESSTRCDPGPEEDPWNAFIRSTRQVNFPPNIAAIRAEHARIDKQKTEFWRNQLKAQSPLLELDLSGIEEVTDLPPPYRRALSARSDELMLYGIFDALRVWVKPAIVVILATDIRDRLFLLNEVRRSLPTALPVLMEMDYLTAHPDYRKITRGALVVPSGDTLLCLDDQNRLTKCSTPERKSYLPFPSDYAANMFRAALGLIEPGEPGDAKDCIQQSYAAPNDLLFTATLAGFQSADKERSILLAADGRLLVERVICVFLLITALSIFAIGFWLFHFGLNHLVMLSPLRHPNPLHGVKEASFQPRSGESDPMAGANQARRQWMPLFLMAIGGVAVALIGYRLIEVFSSDTKGRTWVLAHGFDRVTLIVLLLLFIGISLVAGWRLNLWRRRCRGHLEKLSPSQDPGDDQTTLTVLAVGIASAMLLVSYRGSTNWADVVPVWPAVLFDVALFLIGIWFLVELWLESRRFAWLAQLLAPIAERRSSERGSGTDFLKGPDGTSWASPSRLNALPQSPFSVHFRKRDLAALYSYSKDAEGDWRKDTRSLLDGDWRRSERSFRCWQDRLVAEIRYGMTAIRSCAWVAILAPAAILLGMGVYPPFNERVMTTSAVVLIISAFALVMYVVIKFEQHPLLGPMFTQNGDRLSFGGVVGALWGKLIAAAVILIPVLFPDVLSELYGLLQSIDSLR